VDRNSTCSTQDANFLFESVSKRARGDMRPGEGRVKKNIAGESGGVTGKSMAVGEGGANIFARKRARFESVFRR
jgi:hypothetical protein